ncbi:MAG: hypothetical protein B6I28_01225 [Fusobacteriia bacterium 4572_132]|nr:MAG: hypothetical protein B6I28_01225 [Fusobacteriia bacterium 4572_132]
MIKRQIEIEDDLQDRIKDVKYELKENFIEYLKKNADITDFDIYYQAQGCDIVHELADSSTPIYNNNIDGLYYLYGDEFEEAYNMAGFGCGDENNHKQVTIYCYLSEKGFEFLNELENIFNDYIEEGIKKVIEEIENINL